MIFVCSDWHFSHNKDFVYAARGFASVEEMNQAIVERHNNLVGPEDDVYCLGDCGLGGPGSLAKNKELIESLNGKLHIVPGNHCSKSRIEMYHSCKNVVEVALAIRLKYKKYNFYLSHYPTITENNDDDKPLCARVINLCGHNHTVDKFVDMGKGLIYHVEMEAHNCSPVSLDQVISDIQNFLDIEHNSPEQLRIEFIEDHTHSELHINGIIRSVYPPPQLDTRVSVD